jgi:hypothetical protein
MLLALSIVGVSQPFRSTTHWAIVAIIEKEIHARRWPLASHALAANVFCCAAAWRRTRG